LTFSVAGRCSSTGAFGVIVTSSSPSVGARCPWAKTGVGAILTQNVTDPRLATIGFSVLENGFDAQSAIRSMKEASPYPEYRQIAVVDAKGNSAAFTGRWVYMENFVIKMLPVSVICSAIPQSRKQWGANFYVRKDTLWLKD